MDVSSWLVVESPSTDEFLARPDLRQIATFFSGILFATSTYYFLRNPTLASITSRLSPNSHHRSSIDLNVQHDFRSKSTASLSTRLDPLALVFIMDLVYLTTAATQFGSLLAFSSASGAVPCTFLVAWGGLGSQTVRLIGVLKLSIHLRERGAFRWEQFILWAALAILSIIMFLTTAVSTGVLRPIPQVDTFSLCYMRHFFVGAAIIRGMNLLLQLFLLLRFINLSFPWISAQNSKVTVFRDLQIQRVLSLIVLDGATIYPALFPTWLIADYVPFSAASVLVLIAFNHNAPPRQTITSSIFHPPAASLPQSIRIPTPNFSPFLNMESSESSKAQSNIAELVLEHGSIGATEVKQQQRYTHPSATITPPNAGIPPRHWRSPNRAAGSLVENSGSLSDSMREAVIAVASRTRVLPGNDPVLLEASGLDSSWRHTVGTPEEKRAEEVPGTRHSFLPVIRSTATAGTSVSRGPRPILPRQVEVADQMIANTTGHRTKGSIGSLTAQDAQGPQTPPAPPRPQKTKPAKDVSPLTVPEEASKRRSRDTRPSTSDSAAVFGSDILLRPQKDIMKTSQGDVSMVGDVTGHGSDESHAEPRRRSSLSLPLASPITPIEEQRRLDDARQSSRDIIQEGSPVSRRSPAGRGAESPTSRRARHANNRPTFGESAFERLQRGLFTFTAAQDESPAPSADQPSPIVSPHTHESSSEHSRIPTSSSGSRQPSGSRLRSSTLGSLVDKPNPGQRHGKDPT